MANLSSILTTKHLGQGTGGTGITGGGLGFGFATLTDAISTSLPSGVQWFRTAGRTSPGDKGGGLYVKLPGGNPSWAVQPTSWTPGITQNTGIPQTADGAYWTIVAQNDIVNVNQFGAQATGYNDFTFDNWKYFECAKWWILNQGLGSGLTLQIPSGWYYLSRPFSMEGRSFNLKGENKTAGAVLSVPYSAGVITQYDFSGYQSIEEEGGTFNGFDKFLNQLVYSVATSRVYRVSTAGTSGSEPTGTGTNINTGGTARYDYVRDLYPPEKMGSGCNAVLEGFSCYGYYSGGAWTGTNGSTYKPHHTGVITRGRAYIKGIACNGFAGCGLAVISHGDSMLRGGGNSNGWHVQHYSAYWNALDGLHIGYSDSNAGVAIDIDTIQNGRAGIKNACFLNNTLITCQSAYDGALDHTPQSSVPHMVTYAGRVYFARIQLGGYEGPLDYSATPGTTSAWTYYYGSGSESPWTGAPAFNSSTFYEPGGAFLSGDVNDNSVWMALYMEGGTMLSQFGPKNVVWGAIGLDKNHSGGYVYSEGQWNKDYNRLTSVTDSTTGTSKNFQSQFGNPNSTGEAYAKGVWSATDYEGNTWLLRGTSQNRYDHTDFVFRTLPAVGGEAYGLDFIQYNGFGTANTFGTGASLVHRFVLGDRNGDGRLRWCDTGPPVSGTYRQGDYVESKNFASGQPVGWACTAGGSPGTWTPDRNLP